MWGVKHGPHRVPMIPKMSREFCITQDNARCSHMGTFNPLGGYFGPKAGPAPWPVLRPARLKRADLARNASFFTIISR